MYYLEEKSNPQHLLRMHRLKELSQFVGLQRRQIVRLIKKGDFPQPVSLSKSGRAIAWLENEVIAWQRARIAARNSKSA